MQMTEKLNLPAILSTGGYNDQFLKFISNVFKTKIVKCHEYLRFVIKSIDYLDTVTNDCFFKLVGPLNTQIQLVGKIDNQFKPKQHFFSMKEQLYPYLLVNLRSGASFYRVDSAESFKRVGGSALGVSFIWGVTRYLGIYSDPTEMYNDAKNGDSSKVDMSVEDIYGGDYEGLGLPGRFLASSFGKLKDLSTDEIRDTIDGGDITRSLITMVVANVLVLSKNVAQQENIKRIVWIGSHIDLLEYN